MRKSGIPESFPAVSRRSSTQQDSHRSSSTYPSCLFLITRARGLFLSVISPSLFQPGSFRYTSGPLDSLYPTPSYIHQISSRETQRSARIPTDVGHSLGVIAEVELLVTCPIPYFPASFPELSTGSNPQRAHARRSPPLIVPQAASFLPSTSPIPGRTPSSSHLISVDLLSRV